MVDLVIIYNHKFESNVAKLEKLYRGRFHQIWHLMPFYQGDGPNVIPVYDGSYTFQGFVAHAHRRLMESGAESYLFVGDDLLLDPGINQNNIHHALQLPRGAAYISSFYDLSQGEFSRGVTEARQASLSQRGLQIHGELPPKEEALRLIRRHSPVKSMILQKYSPLAPPYVHPILPNLRTNWNVWKGRVWHRREQLLCWSRPIEMTYPFVGGYADIFLCPRDTLPAFAHVCGVFAAARVFVEIALPTALALTNERISTEATGAKSGFDVWFPPPTWGEMIKRKKTVDEIESVAGRSLERLAEAWPSDTLFIHPMKLSKWS